MIYDVTDLDVYNRSLKALNLIYKLEKQIPKSHYKLAIQLTSPAEGIPAHIAEGFAKRRSIEDQLKNLCAFLKLVWDQVMKPSPKQDQLKYSLTIFVESITIFAN